MTEEIQRVHFEKNGEVRDGEGRRVGIHDPQTDAAVLAELVPYVGKLARVTRLSAADVAGASRDLRKLALPGGELGQEDVVTPATFAGLIAGTYRTVADIVSPITFIPKTYGSYLNEDVSSDIANPVQPSQAGTGSAPLLNPKLAKATVDATADLSLATVVPDETVMNSDINLLRMCARRLINAHKLNRELRVAGKLMTAGTWTNQTVATAKWDGGTSNNPLGDVFTALGKSIVPPTHLLFTEPAAQYFFASTNVFQYLSSGGPLPEIIVADMRYITGGAAGYVWGAPTSANAILVFAPSDPEAVSTFRTYRYVGDAPDKTDPAPEAFGFMLRTFVDESAGARGQRNLVMAINEQDAALNTTMGGIITGVLA